MTVKELLEHSEQALRYIEALRASLDKAREEDPFSVIGSEAAVAQAIPIFLQESQAYSQLAQARMQYEAQSNGSLDESVRVWGSHQ